MEWQKIETAPKDGSLILLLSKTYDAFEESDGTFVHVSPHIGFGKWRLEGTSWVDEYGNIDGNGDSYHLATTGVWESAGGWFQPNEVTHWCPIPALPEE